MIAGQKSDRRDGVPYGQGQKYYTQHSRTVYAHYITLFSKCQIRAGE